MCTVQKANQTPRTAMLPFLHHEHYIAGLQNQQWSPGESQSSQYGGHADAETMMVWPCLLYAWYMNPKGAIRWKTRQRGSKKMLERLTEGPVDSGWHQPQTLGTACRKPCSMVINNKKSSTRFWDHKTRGSRREEMMKGSTRAGSNRTFILMPLMS